MKVRKSSLVMGVGLCLILAGLCLGVFFYARAEQGDRLSRDIAAQLEAILPEEYAGMPGLYPDSGMPVLQVEGADYAALLEVPAFGVTLPVADRWDSSRLSLTPARFCGSVYDGTLVIGGGRQFDFCGKIDLGAAVTVTDMTGGAYTYTVARVDRADHADTQWLMDEAWDLTLFYHDVYAMEYIAVRCVE